MGISSYSWNIPSQLHEAVYVCRAPPRTWRFSNIYHTRVDAHLCGCNIRSIKSRSTASTRLSAYAHWLQTDKHLWLVITHTLIALCCTWQSRAPNIDRCAPEIWPRLLTLTRDLDPDLWPWPSSKVAVTLWRSSNDGQNKRPFWVKLDPHAKNQGQRFSQESTNKQINEWTDGPYRVHCLPALRC